MRQELTIKVSGACTGSTGVMGISGIITDNENCRCLHIFSRCAGMGNIQKAVYLALLESVESACTLSIRPGKVLIQSDSHFLLCQINHKTEMESELAELRAKIELLLKGLECEVNFTWIPYEQNKQAVALAQNCIGMPVALVQGFEVIEWQENCSDMDKGEMTNILPSVNPDTASQISKLNELKNICPTRIISLLSNGMDKYSRAKADELLKYVEARFGTATREYMTKTLAGCELNYSKGVLRWAARGLKPPLAFMKANLEIQIKDVG